MMQTLKRCDLVPLQGIKRQIFKKHFLLHTTTFQIEKEQVTIRRARDIIRRNKLDNQLIEDVIASKTRINRERIKKILKSEKDYIFTAQEAIKEGYLQNEDHIKIYKVPTHAYLIMLHDPEDGEK